MSVHFDPWGKEDAPTGSTASTASTGSQGRVLAEVRDWFARFVCTVDESDLDLLTLWAAHTHLCVETYTSPRLVLDSPVPGSGKTTVLEHLERLCLSPVQMASVSSPAMLARLLDAGMRSILIDEADRSLNPKKDGVEDLLAVLNSGYKRGATRPVLTPTKDGWRVSEMPTYSPVAMAGNNPDLPDDTKSRCIRVLLMPDVDGTAEESDWEWIDEEARDLGKHLATWADAVRDEVRANRPDLPEGVKGRARERWAPLKRVAAAAGGRWPAVVDELATRDVERILIEREEGITQQRPHVVLLAHVREAWHDGETFVSTEELIDRLVERHPEMWGRPRPTGSASPPSAWDGCWSPPTTSTLGVREASDREATSPPPWPPLSAALACPSRLNRLKLRNRLNRGNRLNRLNRWGSAENVATRCPRRSSQPARPRTPPVRRWPPDVRRRALHPPPTPRRVPRCLGSDVGAASKADRGGTTQGRRLHRTRHSRAAPRPVAAAHRLGASMPSPRPGLPPQPRRRRCRQRPRRERGVLMYAVDPDRPRPRRLPLKPCPHCDATVRGCDTTQWLHGRRCCPDCTADHPTEETTR